jgi:hypothetical protein
LQWHDKVKTGLHPASLHSAKHWLCKGRAEIQRGLEQKFCLLTLGEMPKPAARKILEALKRELAAGNLNPTLEQLTARVPANQLEPVKRVRPPKPRRNKPSVSNLLTDYMAYNRAQKAKRTCQIIQQSFEDFIRLVGDLPIDEVTV